jgi:hypothetical protein
VRIELEVSTAAGIVLIESDDAPSPPKASSSIGANIPRVRPFARHPGEVTITRYDDRTRIEMDCKDIQPGRTIWSNEFYIAATRSGQVSLPGRIFAANLAQPTDFTLTVSAEISERSVPLAELLDIAKKAAGERET